MMNSYAESGSGFNSNHGQTSRPAEAQKQQSIASTWNYNGQLDSMYYNSEHQPMFVGSYDGTSKHPNYPQYPSGALHQPVPAPVVKCHEACCQHFQDRYPINPAPLRYQPSGLVQPRFGELPNADSRQYFTDRRTMPALSRKKVYAENGYPSTTDRRIPQYVGRGQLHLDSRQQMQMIKPQYPIYPPYWGSPRGWAGSRMNCPPPPPYHQSISQGAQLKMTDGSHYIDPTAQKSLSTQHRRAVGSAGTTDLIRPSVDHKRSALDPNSQGCYEFGYPTGFVPFSEVNKIQGGSLTSQGGNSSCKMPNDKQYHPHQMQYAMQSGDRSLMSCGNPINDISYPMNFPLPGSDSFMRPALDDGQSISDTRKMQYDSLSKKRPDLDLRQYLSTWEDDEDESSRITESIAIGNNGAPYIVVDCRSLEGEAAAKLQERLKTAQSSSSKSRSNSPNCEQKQVNEQSRKIESSDKTEGTTDFQNPAIYAPSMPTLLNDNDKSLWNNLNKDDGAIGKGGAFQPLDCSKRDVNQDTKRDTHPHADLAGQKLPITNENSNMSLDALVSYYGDSRRIVDGGYDFVEMTERLVNNNDKTLLNSRSLVDHTLPSEMPRPCDPRLQQSQLGNNPSIYSKVTSRYPTTNYQNYKPGMQSDPYCNYKHPMSSNKYFGYDNSQMVDPNYEYHKIAAELDSSRFYGNSKDVSKDPRRMYPQDVDKNVESAFYDPTRKSQLADCFQEKTNAGFPPVDPDQFINPVTLKKSLEPREKLYPDKNHAIRDHMDALNSTNLSQSAKTVVITSQNGPPEIFRVPISPDKELSNKDNVVTLHAGDQSKIGTMTVEVPYVQQYSTLVKLSEEISRAEKDEETNTDTSDKLSNKKSNIDEFKKPTCFKLKRVPNSKEWTVEGKEPCGTTSTMNVPECESTAPTSSTCEVDVRDAKQVEAVSILNMPSLDDIRDGEVSQSSMEDQLSKKRPSDGGLSSSNVCSSSDETNKIKPSSQTPQMAIVQPMTIRQCNNKTCDEDFENHSDLLVSASAEKSIEKENSQNTSKEEKLLTDSDISKHGNFRAHKKIQSGFSNALPSCIVSSNEDFLHTQNISAAESKESYSPFHSFPECDVNSQLSDYFKIDDRNSGGKILDNSSRVPSSPGVDAMFEDINSSNHNQIYPAKDCNFHDIAVQNNSLNNHNAHFHSFSSIFSEESEKIGRPDGSVLQMNEKKYLKNIFDDIGHDEQGEINILNEINVTKSEETKKSPPIPPISLKLNETKKMWCIANKAESSVPDDTIGDVADVLPKSTIEHCSDMTSETEGGLESDLEQALHEGSTLSKSYKPLDVSSSLLDLNDNEQHSCCESQNDSDLNKLICEEIDKHNADSLSNILEIDYKRNYHPALEEATNQEKENLSQLQNANKCRSLVKYCFKSKVLNQISLKRTDKYKILIFDQYGNHFTQKSCFEAQNEVNAYPIVQDLLNALIYNAINKSEQQKGVLDNTSHDMKRVNDVESIDKIRECENSKNDSVIKFDCLSHLKKPSTSQTSVLSITKNCENNCDNSVIKTAQLESFDGKKMIRSIFSPESEGCDQEDSINDKIIEQPHLMETDGHNCNEDGHCEVNSKHALDLSYKRKLSPDSTGNNVTNLKINQDVVPIARTNGMINEESTGLMSPKANLIKNQNFPNCVKDNLEIDEALELMGLATSNSIGNETKRLQNIDASLAEDLNNQSPDLLDNSSESQENSQNRFINTRSPAYMLEEAKKIESSPETSSNSSECSKTLIHKSAITESDNAITVDSPIIKERSVSKSITDIGSKPESYESVSMLQDTAEVEAPRDLLSQVNGKRKCDSKNPAVEEPEKKLIKTGNLKPQQNNSDWESLNSTSKSITEDVESRLETSVIVRNESCTSRIFKDTIPNLLSSEKNTNKNSHLLPNGLKRVNDNSSTLGRLTPETEHVSIIEVKQNISNRALSQNPSSCMEIAKISSFHDPIEDSGKVIKDISDNFNAGNSKDSIKDNAAKPTGKIVTSASFGKQKEPIRSPYCSSESLFLSIDDANSYLEISKQSYFYEYKRRKWMRYSKSTTNSTVNDYCFSIVKPILTKEDNDNSTNNANLEVVSVVQEVKSRNGNRKTNIKLSSNEHIIGSECQETLKNVSPSTLPGKKIFCVRRDSLKILEPEAVLKEIFSPESVSNDSDSKENECPTDNLPQSKLSDFENEPLIILNHTPVIAHGATTTENKVKDASDQFKSKSSEKCGSFYQTDAGSNIGCNENESISIKSTEKVTLDTIKVKKQIDPMCTESDDNLTYQSQNFHNKSDIQSSNDEATHPCDSKELPKTVIYRGPDLNCSGFMCTSPTLSTIKDSNNVAFSPLLETTQIKSPDPNRLDNAKQQPFNGCNLKTPSNLNEINLEPSLQDAPEIVNKTLNDMNANSSQNKCQISKWNNVIVSMSQNNIMDVAKINDIDKTLISTSLKSVSMNNTTCTENNYVGYSAEAIDNEMSLDDSHLNSEKEKESYRSPTNFSVNGILSENEPIHCTLSRCAESLNVTVDLLPSTNKNEGLRTSNGTKVDDFTKEHDELDKKMMASENKTIDESYAKNNFQEDDLNLEERKEANDEQDLKVTRFQDSFINNHNLNKENPLQCLVEAALALENVESNILNNNIKHNSKNEPFEQVKNSVTNNDKRSSYEKNILTPSDKEIFSKYEETNYNLRASTRIVTSSSSNIIHCPKRKYTFKSSKMSNKVPENKANQSRMEKCRSKKRKSGFTYPRSKRRKKVPKNQAVQQLVIKDISEGEILKNEISKCDTLPFSSTCHNSENDMADHKENHYMENLEKSNDLVLNTKLCLTTNSDNSFGGPLIIANNHNSPSENNVLCDALGPRKKDQFENDLNLDLEDLSENQSLFKESSVCVDTSHQTLENSTSLVIIFENLVDDNSAKENLEERKKGESDIILGSIDSSCSVLCLPQSDSPLDDCAELLTTEFSVNESCICPPGLKMKESTDRNKINKQYESIESESLLSKSTYDEDNLGKFSETGNRELLAATCYEELNENLVNDIGNWPFVEEEVTEFHDKNELPNKIPEEGRKIELKCSLPWKKIFNISRKRKSKESTKISGLELGPAKVEVRLRAPSSEWKVISDFYDNASPVVKVKRLILQRDTDLSSLSEKDSEEENDQKRKEGSSNNLSYSVNPSEVDLVDNNRTVTDITVDELWQPVVLLKRIENLDGISLLEKEQTPPSPSASTLSNLSSYGKSSTGHSHSEREEREETSFYSHHNTCSNTAIEQSSPSVHNMDNDLKCDNSENEVRAKFQAYETYSPSNSGNNFTGEKLYSPSDPHFSPEAVFKDFESDSSHGYIHIDGCSSDKEDECDNESSQENVGGNVQTEPGMDVQKEIQSVIDSYSCTQGNEANSSLDQESYAETNNYIQQNESGVSSDLLQGMDEGVGLLHHCQESEKSSFPLQISESPKLTDAPNFLHSDSLTKRDLPNVKPSLSDETIKFLDNKVTLPKTVTGQSTKSDLIGGKRESPRKMPKNFFVRRRIRKQNHSKCPYNNSHLMEGNRVLSERPFTFPSNYQSMPDSICYANNHRDLTCSHTSTDSQNERSSVSNEHQSNSESDATLVGGSSRLQSTCDSEVSPSVVHNESPLVEKFEVKQRLRDGGRGTKRPSEGHSKEDTKRRRKKIKKSNMCHECNIRFESKEELTRHNTCRHTRRRELHHCLLCHRSFSSAVRHSLHLQGRSHRHLELMQRHTMHAMHHLLVGGEFPLIAPLSRAELRALQWRPAQPGYAHFYHHLTPLQAALQEHNTDVSEDTTSEDRMPND